MFAQIIASLSFYFVLRAKTCSVGSLVLVRTRCSVTEPGPITRIFKISQGLYVYGLVVIRNLTLITSKQMVPVS